MKKVEVQLSKPRQIDGQLRRPEEGPILVSQDEAKAIKADDAGDTVGKAKTIANDADDDGGKSEKGARDK